MIDKLGRFIKGHRSSKNTEFKKGFTPWNKGTKGVMKGFWKGKKFSQEHRDNMSKAFTGRIGFWRSKKRPAEMYERIVAKRKAGVGYVVSQETRKKISKVNKGKFREEAPNWKGGIAKHPRGYILLYNTQHPYCSVSGRIKRSRLVMEKYLRRYLKPGEVVHHKGINYPIGSIKNRQDDSINNLMLFNNNTKHLKFHRL